MPTDSPLLQELIARGALIDGEDVLLRSPEVLALSPREQLAYLGQNRRVGRFVTALAGGVRLFFIAGALVAHVSLTTSGDIPFGWWSPLVWLGLTCVLWWLMPPFVGRIRDLGRALPSATELNLP